MNEKSLAGTVHTVWGKFNPYYLIANDDSIVVVDVGFHSDADLIMKYVRQSLGRSVKEIKLIVVTHYHVDHINGIDHLVDKTGAAIMAHANARKRFSGKLAPEMLSDSDMKVFFDFSFKKRFPRPSLMDMLRPLAGIPGIPKGLKSKVAYWVKDSQSVPFAPGWVAIHTRGHTDDSICLYNAQLKALITGDTIINLDGQLRLNPLIMPHPATGMKSLVRLKELEIDHIYPGLGDSISQPSIIKDVLTLDIDDAKGHNVLEDKIKGIWKASITRLRKKQL